MTSWHFIAPPNAAVEKSLGIVRCSVCSRPLTDPESVAAGIGPVCKSHGVAKHMGPRMHPSGSSQQAHAGGRGKAKPKGRAETKPVKTPTSHVTAGNAFAKLAAVRTVQPFPGSGEGKHTKKYRNKRKGDVRKKFGKMLAGLGYERYKDPMRAKHVTSYQHERNKDIRAYMDLYNGYTYVSFQDKRKSKRYVEMPYAYKK